MSLVNSNSANWNNAYTNLVYNSTAYLSGFDSSLIASNSSNWNNAYTNLVYNSTAYLSGFNSTAITQNSANWNTSYTNLIYNSAAYLSAYDMSLVNSNSANWNNAYTNLIYNSANYLSGASVSYVNTNFVKISGDTMTGGLNTPTISASNGYFSTNASIGTYPPLYFDLDVNGAIGNGTIGSSYGNLGLGASGDISINPNNNLLLGPVGNVGVGTTTPSEKLDVNGNIKATGGSSNEWNNAYTNLVYNSTAYLSGFDSTAITQNSANWNTAYTNLVYNSTAYLSAYDMSLVNSNSANWNNTYTQYSTYSAIYARTDQNVTFQNDVTISGNLTAKGTATFANTIFTTTSALSVINTGPGPALYVFQASGPSDIASFYDGDGVEVLHVGNAQGGGNPLGQVGINTSFPSAELTVNGAISSNGVITVLDGNSNQWNNSYTNLIYNSTAYLSGFNSTAITQNSANWNTSYTNLVYNSAAYLSAVDISLITTTSGSWNSNYTIINSTSSSYIRGIDWNSASISSSYAWVGVAYGNGVFVAVASDYGIAYSRDGINWVLNSSYLTTNNWTSVTFGRGIFVAVANGGANRVMTSPDGVNWTLRSVEASSWKSITYGNGLFVAVANSGTNRVMTSSDGITWTPVSVTSIQWNGVTYGNGVFVAVASSASPPGATRVMTSPDGVTWTMRTASSSDQWNCITYGNGLFAAGAGSGTARIMTSPDGITWTPRSVTGGNWQSITYSGGVYVAVSTSVTGSKWMYSFDGIIWIVRTGTEVETYAGVTYGNGMFVIVANAGTNRALYSGRQIINETLDNIRLGGFTITDFLSTNGIVYVSGGNSNQWNSNYTTVNSNSANWNTSYTNLVYNSAAYLSAYDMSLINSNSANWNTSYTNLIYNSSAYLSGFNSTAITQNSANWNTSYTNLIYNSSAYLSGVDISLITTTSGSWNSNYTTTNSNSSFWSSYTQNFSTFNTNLATVDPSILWVSTLSGVLPGSEISNRLSTSRGKIRGKIFFNMVNSVTNKNLYLRFADNNTFTSATNIVNAGNANTQTLIRTFEGILLPGNQIIFSPSQGNVEDGVRNNPFTTYNYTPGASIFYQIGLSIGTGSEFVAISGGYISVTPD
jgi:hypothetical protein